MEKLIKITLAVMLLGGCVGAEPDSYSQTINLKPAVDVVESEVANPIEFSICSSRTDDIYGLTVETLFEDCEDAKHGTEIFARTAIMLARVWESRGYPENEKVKQYLSSFTVYIAHSIESMAHFNSTEEEVTPELIEKAHSLSGMCYVTLTPRFVDVSPDSHFIMAFRPWVFNPEYASYVVAHEIAHAALYAAYGDADNAHTRSDIWEMGGESTLVSEVTALSDR